MHASPSLPRGPPPEPLCPSPSRGLHSTARTVRPARATLRTPLPCDPARPGMPSPRGALSPPRAPVPSPRTCCHRPGPASPPPLPLSHLFPSRSSAARPLAEPLVRSRGAGSGRAEPPPAVSASRPTLSRRTPPPPPPPGATRTLPRPPLLLSEVRLLPGVANRTRLRRARSAPRSQSARPLPPATPPARLR